VYTDLIDASNLALGSTTVFSTKEGFVRKGSKLPPNLLSVNFSTSSSSQSHTPVNSVEVVVERSCKISFTPDLLNDVVELITEILNTFRKSESKQETKAANEEPKKKYHYPLPTFKISTHQFLIELILDMEEGHFGVNQEPDFVQ